MAVTIDLGQSDDIHPKNKAEVGKRLALAAEHCAYNRMLVYTGPVFEQVVIDANQIRILFKNPENRGIVVHGDSLIGFEIAGADKRFYTAQATIYRDWVIVKSPNVPKPIAVRYGWGDNPKCNLYNKEGLPASPFRTDEWSH
jgi:sialate O-acetylesterase